VLTIAFLKPFEPLNFTVHWEEDDVLAYSITGWRGYAIAIGLVVLATLLRFVLGLLDTGILYFALFYPAVVIATLLSGYRAGLLALIASLMVVWYLFLPFQFSFVLKNPAAPINIVLFVLSSGLLVWLSNNYRNAVRDLQEQKSIRDLLLEEVRHRSRNSVAVAKTIVDNSLRSDPETAATINGRLATLLSADALLMEETGAGERLQTVLSNELNAFGPEQIIATGPDIVLPARHARAWALIVHEIATNAVKYGALGHESGKVLITWLRVADTLDFRWVETGVPDVRSPGANGFGTRLIDAMVRSLGGTIVRTVEPDGMNFSINVPLDELRPTMRPTAPDRPVQKVPA
jgi:two-component sensor histidine kinase